MLTYAEKAEAFVAGVDLEGFRNDEQKAFAVVWALEVIGEAARHIPPLVRRRYPEVPWEKILGVRNILVHGYFGIDLEVIWRTVHEDLPPLRQAIARILQSQEQRTDEGHA